MTVISEIFRKGTIMQYTTPHYYKKFHCTGSDCPATCCAGWQIQIDPASLRKYRKVRGPLGNRLRNEIDWKEGCFRRYSGRCAFLNEKNLCDLYLEGGGSRAFCRTCRTYPRHIEEFEGLREISLSLSCPVAAELILYAREPIRFLHGENPDREETYDDFDFFLFTKLLDARGLIIRFLQNREHPFRLRAAVCLALAHDLQERIDRNALFEADTLFERYDSPGVWDWFSDRLEEIKKRANYADIQRDTEQALFSLLDHLEVLSPDWPPYLQQIRKVLSANGKSCLPEQDFSSFFTDTMEEQLLIYFVFTYFCGAVYTGNAYSKMKFAFSGTLLIRELVRGEWLQAPDQCDKETVIRTACRCSREVEHSDYNKVTMERMLEKDKRFGIEELFSLL